MPLDRPIDMLFCGIDYENRESSTANLKSVKYDPESQTADFFRRNDPGLVAAITASYTEPPKDQPKDRPDQNDPLR